MAPETKLYACQPHYWIDAQIPKGVRLILGWITIMIFSLSFLSIPFCIPLLFPWTWRVAPVSCTLYLSSVILSMILPLREWPFARKIGQLWYEIFQFSANISPQKRKEMIERGDAEQFIIGMHPHGIVPFHAVLWASYCDQYLSDENGRALYGFGAAADVVGYVPFLRNIMGWLTAASAEYKVLRAGLVEGKSAPANAVGRKPKHLYVLPGGVAEVFLSTIGRNAIVFKDRRGLVRLSIETRAKIVPAYVFGGTDFYYNLATGTGILSKLSRKLRSGLTLFWGPFGLPIPFTPKVTLIVGDPLNPPELSKDISENSKNFNTTNEINENSKGKSARIPDELADKLHNDLLAEIIKLFEDHKVIAGYPNAKLEIL